MTDPSYTHYLLIIDRSGSMHKIKHDAEGGIRHFMAEQAKLPGRATISICQFDGSYDMILDFADLKTAPEYTLTPRGATALLDACGFAITRTGEALEALEESSRPGKVVVFIVTDGENNASREYDLGQVKELITEHQGTYGWQFSYAGANVDAFANSKSMGIPANSTMSFAASSAGIGSTFTAMTRATKSYVGGQAGSLSYTDAERAKAAGNS